MNDQARWLGIGLYTVAEATTDKFGPPTPDAEWLEMLAQQGGCAFISNDQLIWRTRKSAQQCWRLR